MRLRGAERGTSDRSVGYWSMASSSIPTRVTISIVAGVDRLLVNLKALSVPAIEPGIGADLPREAILGPVAEQHGEGEAFRKEILAPKPAVGHVGRTGKPFSAPAAVAHETRHEVAILDQADCYPLASRNVYSV